MLTVTEAVTKGYTNIASDSKKSVDKHRAKRIRRESDADVMHVMDVRDPSPLRLTTQTVDDEIDPDEPLNVVARRKSNRRPSGTY